jgi:DNA gyrase/topoisomerase IV subunit B
MKKAPKIAHISRLKGLGESSADELRKYGFNPKNRKLIQIQPIKREKNSVWISGRRRY